MSLWAGATLYLRVQDSGREVYVPQGLTLQHQHACWKLKRDPVSAKAFYVNMGGLGKKWRLPDIYDPRNEHYLQGKPAPTRPKQPTAPSPEDMTSPQHHESVSYMTEVPATPPPPTATAPTPSAKHAPRSPTPPPPLPPDSFAYHSSQLDLSPLPGMPGGPDETTEHRDPEAQPLMQYGDDALWDAMSPVRRAQLKKEREERLAQEKATMERLAAMGDAGILGEPHAGWAPSPERARLEEALQRQLRAKAWEAEVGHSAESRESSAVRQESEKRDASYTREMSAISELEAQHDVLIKQSLHMSLVPADDASGVRPASPPYPGDRSLVDGSSSAVGAQPASPPTVVGSRSGPDPWTVMSEQLDIHQTRAEDLQRQLQERDRLLLEHKLADAERERREIALRVRMVEALAAYRQRMDTLVEEEQASATRAITARASQGRHSSVPRHPLMDNDLSDF